MSLASGPADVKVNIRDGSITSGTILGTSFTESIPSGFSGVVHFHFPSTVSLPPSPRPYLIEPVLVSGDTSWANADDGYAGGSAILQGAVDVDEDFWFREGLHGNAIPEPSTFALALLGLLSLSLYAWRRRRRA